MSRPGAFKPGQSGNPKGRTPGIRDKRTAYRKLIEDHGELLIKVALQMAIKDKDTVVLVALMNRLLPTLRPESLPVPVSALRVGLPIEANAHEVVSAVAVGDLNLDEGSQLLGMLKIQGELIQQGSVMDAVAKLLEDRDLELPAELRVRLLRLKREDRNA